MSTFIAQDSIQQLNTMISMPRLYVSDFFLDLKSQVDLYFVKNNSNKTVWLRIIELLNRLEKECLNKVEKNDLKIDESTQIEQEIQSLNRIFFNNKSFLFLDKISCQDASFFSDDTDAKLIVINDDWISSESVEWLKNK